MHVWTRLDFLVNEAATAALFRGQATAQGLRKLLARLDTEYRIGLPSTFFGYGEDGAPDSQAVITTSFGTTRNGLSITAIGAPACEVLSERSGALNAALMHAAQALIPMHVRSAEHTADFLPFARRYYIGRLAVGNANSQSFWSQAVDAIKAGSSWMEQAPRKIPQTIARGMFFQARHLCELGDELEGNMSAMLSRSFADGAPWGETKMAFYERLDVQLLSVAGHTYAPLHNRPHRLLLKGVEFTMKAQLDGPWFVGRLKGESQGLLVPSFKAVQALEAAA